MCCQPLASRQACNHIVSVSPEPLLDMGLWSQLAHGAFPEVHDLELKTDSSSVAVPTWLCGCHSEVCDVFSNGAFIYSALF